MKILISIISLIVFSNIQAQKHDYFWPMGYDLGITNPDFGGIDMVFSDDSLMINRIDRDLHFVGIDPIAIADDNGIPLFYTDLCNVFSAKTQELMEEGDSINGGTDFYELTCVIDDYGIGSKGIALPGFSEDEYFIFHLRARFYSPPIVPFESQRYDELLYTRIDMSANNGAGKVVEKNQFIHRDSFFLGYDFTAVKHADNSSWWMLMNSWEDSRIFKFLFDEEGVHGPYIQELEVPLIWNEYTGGGQSKFSPDGNQYVYSDVANGVMLYDFDRTTGDLVHLENLELVLNIDEMNFGAGVSFSPNGKYLYASTLYDFFQFDLSANDIFASRKLISHWNPSTQMNYENFGRHILGPDCKLYISSGNATKFWTIIHNPDAPFEDLEVDIAGLELPVIKGFGVPNFPNYRLGTGEVCDPNIGLVSSTTSFPKNKLLRSIAVPNPNEGSFSIRWDFPFEGELNIYDALGELAATLSIKNNQRTIHPSVFFPNGLYHYEFRDKQGEQRSIGKIVVQ